MAKVKFKVDGFKAIEDALLALPRSTSRGVARRAMTKALEPVAASAKAAAPRGETGNLISGISVGSKLSKRQAREARGEMARLGISRDALVLNVGASNARHAHLVEFGTGPRYHKSGKYVGQMPPQPFMRPAWDANQQGVLDGLSASLWSEIEKTLARAAKRAARQTGGSS